MTPGCRSSGSSGPAPSTSRRSASCTASTVASPTGRPAARNASATRCGDRSPGAAASRSRTSSSSPGRSIAAPAVTRPPASDLPRPPGRAAPAGWRTGPSPRSTASSEPPLLGHLDGDGTPVARARSSHGTPPRRTARRRVRDAGRPGRGAGPSTRHPPRVAGSTTSSRSHRATSSSTQRRPCRARSSTTRSWPRRAAATRLADDRRQRGSGPAPEAQVSTPTPSRTRHRLAQRPRLRGARRSTRGRSHRTPAADSRPSSRSSAGPERVGVDDQRRARAGAATWPSAQASVDAPAPPAPPMTPTVRPRPGASSDVGEQRRPATASRGGQLHRPCRRRWPARRGRRRPPGTSPRRAPRRAAPDGTTADLVDAGRRRPGPAAPAATPRRAASGSSYASGCTPAAAAEPGELVAQGRGHG